MVEIGVEGGDGGTGVADGVGEAAAHCRDEGVRGLDADRGLEGVVVLNLHVLGVGVRRFGHCHGVVHY